MSKHVENSEVLSQNEIDLEAFFSVIWKGRKTIVYISAAFILVSIFISLFLPNLYKSESLLMIRDSNEGSPLSQFAPLASLGGLNLSQSGAGKAEEVIELIKSRDFVKHLIGFDNVLLNLMAVKSYDLSNKTSNFDEDIYDPISKDWIEKPNYLEVHRKYISNILSVSQDKVTKLISIKVEHVSPDFAEEFLKLIIAETNSLKRFRDLENSEKALTFLQKELGRTKLVEMKESINQLIRSQLETRMMAQIYDDYSLIYIEPPFLPDRKSGPSRSIIVLLSAIMGIFFGISAVLIKYFSSRMSKKK